MPDDFDREEDPKTPPKQQIKKPEPKQKAVSKEIIP